jgi:HK97 family phage major capsid protein
VQNQFYQANNFYCYMAEKIMIQLENGKEIDLKSVLADANIEQLKELGFPMTDEMKVDMSAFRVSEKSESAIKTEESESSANFIKHMVLPAKMHDQYGVKALEVKEAANSGGSSFGNAIPTELANAILEKKAKFQVLRGRAFAFQMSGPFDLPIEGDGINGFWVGELDAGDANLVTESNPTITKKALDDYYLAALVKVSWKLMNTSPINIVNYVSALAGRKLAEVEEAAFVAGDGTGKPTGLRTETITSIAQAGAALAYQDLVDLYFTLPAPYRGNAVMMTSAKGAAAITGLRDTNDMPIFAPGQPLDQIFRKPMLESINIPENLGAGTDETEIYFGDPFYYWIKDGQTMQMATDDVIERLQTKVLVYQAVDGKLTLPEAWCKMTAVKS